MDPYSLGVVLSIVAYVVIGNHAGRKVRHLDEYYVAGRNAPTLLIVGTLVASFLSTGAFLGETGFAYDGYAGLLLIVVTLNSAGYILGALYFGRFVRRSGTLTLPEYFGRRFASRRVQAAAGVTVVIGITAYLLGVTQGASLLVSELTGIPYSVSLALVWAGYTTFTLYSGSPGVVLTDTIMLVVFAAAAFAAAPYVVGAGGGWMQSVAALAVYAPKTGIIAWHGFNGAGAYWQTPVESLVWALLIGVAWSGVVAVSPWQTSRYLMARNEHVVLRSACISTVVLLVLYLALVTMGAAINLSKPDIANGEKAILWAATHLMPVPVGVLLVCGIVAAGLSSCSTFLSIVGFSVSHDLFEPPADETQRMARSRIAIFATGLVALALAYYQPPSVMWVVYFAGTVFASSWGPIAFLSVWSRRVTAEAAFASIVTGFTGNVAAKLLDHYGIVDLPVYLDPFVVGLACSLAAAVLVSRHTVPSAAAIGYRERLHETPAGEYTPGELRRTLLWHKVALGAGVGLVAVMTCFYALPYERAVAATSDCAARAAASACASSGGFALALGYGLPLCLVAALAHHQIRRRYSRAADGG